MHMRSSFYFFGFLTTFFLALGLLFQIMNWPYQAWLQLCGFMFLIVAAIMWFNGSMRLSRRGGDNFKTMVTMGLAAALLTAGGSIFRIMHWPYGYVALIMGLLIAIVGFLPLYFYHAYKQNLDR